MRVQRCKSAGFRRDLQFPRGSSSAVPHFDFPPKISALQGRFFRQAGPFQGFLSSGSLRFQALPKISAIKAHFFRQTSPFQGHLSSGSPKLLTSPKELPISKHSFRQSLQFSPYPSSKKLFITGLPKMVPDLHPLPYRLFSSEALPSLSLRTCWEQDPWKSKRDGCPSLYLIRCGTKIKANLLPWQQERRLFDEPVTMIQNLFPMTTESGKTA